MEIASRLPKLIIIQGPTASGKSSLALSIAKHFDTEIISADARQLFSELNIGTAKPSSNELNQIVHHFIGSYSIHQNYTASHYANDALALIMALFKTKELVVLVGGSNMYIDALINGLDAIPSDLDVRHELTDELEKKGIDYLLAELKNNDPETYAQIDINNPQRVVRAVEAIRLSGSKLSALKTASKRKHEFEYYRFAVDWDRAQLYERINHRVDLMMNDGLLTEVKDLLPHKTLNALKTVGYKELISYLEGEMNLEKAVELIKQHSRNYAKRQLTWLRRYEDLIWLQPNSSESLKIQLLNAMGNELK